MKKHKICNGFSSCIGMHSRSAAAAVALTLSQSAAAVQSQLPVDTPARTDGANKKCIHMRVYVCVWVHTYIHYACHCHTLACCPAPTHSHTGRESEHGPTFEFGFVSPRSHRRHRGPLFARFYPLVPRASALSLQPATAAAAECAA